MSSYIWNEETGMANVSGYLPAALPSNMAFDHIRNKLWWVDNTTVYMSDNNVKEIYTNDLYNQIDGLLCVTINSENGLAFIGGFTSNSACVIIMNNDNSNVVNIVDIPDSNITNPN